MSSNKIVEFIMYICYYNKMRNENGEVEMRKEFVVKVSSEIVDYVEDSLNCMLEEVEIMYDGDSSVEEIVKEYKVEIENVMKRIKK